MPNFNSLQLERDSRGFATLWLNRGDKHNAFNAEMIAELLAALKLVEQEQNLRFMLLRARGKHFSAGADLTWMQASAGLDYAANLADAEQLAELMYRLHALPIPTLAVVQGAAFGGALGLISCCDLAIGTETALFALSEVRIGLIPAVISPFVVQAIGSRAARRYALTGDRFDGLQARALGLLAETTSAELLDELVEGWIHSLLSNGPQAMRASKALLQEVVATGLSQDLRQYSEQAIARIRVSVEGQEGLSAFLEKRRPAWQETH